jgi:6-pyruvoyltetrahydropterin/6-carboxytetrahydropterin synthase
MTSMRQITLHHSIDAAHRVVGHEGKCARLHGHTYHFIVEVSASGLRPPDFVIDFAVIKRVLNEWDHKCLLWDDDPMVVYESPGPQLAEDLGDAEDNAGVIRLPLNPTSENMAMIAADEILVAGLAFNPQIEAVTVVCSETPKSSSSYTSYRR